MMKLRGIHADVLLAAHGFWFDLEEKAARQRAGRPQSLHRLRRTRAPSQRDQAGISSTPKLKNNSGEARSNGLTTWPLHM